MLLFLHVKSKNKEAGAFASLGFFPISWLQFKIKELQCAQGYAVLSNFATRERVTQTFPSLFTPWVSISTQPHGEHFQVFLWIKDSREISQKWYNHLHISEEKTFSQQPGMRQHLTQTCRWPRALQVLSYINMQIISQRNSDHGQNRWNNSELFCREKSKTAAQCLCSWRKWKMEMYKDNTKWKIEASWEAKERGGPAQQVGWETGQER